MAEVVLLRVPEAAAMLGVGRSTIYELFRTGEISPVRIGRAVRVPVRAVYEYAERLQLDGEAG